MMEVALLLLGKMFGGKSRPKTITETVTTYSGTVPELRKWKDAQTQQMIENQARIASRPHSERVYDTFRPISQDPIRTSGPSKTIGITGGPPLKKTVTTFKRTL